MSFPYNEPTLLKGGVSVDDRGSVRFINDFNFPDVKRFYIVENHEANFVRAWHGHKQEGKYIYCASGSIIVGAVKIDNWDNPSDSLPVARQVLSYQSPGIYAIPPGYANGFMSLTEDAKVVIFSTSTIEQSLKDDFRYSARKWNIWNVEER